MGEGLYQVGTHCCILRGVRSQSFLMKGPKNTSYGYSQDDTARNRTIGICKVKYASSGLVLQKNKFRDWIC